MEIVFHFIVKGEACALTLVFLYTRVFLPDDGRLVRLKHVAR
jgi:hypothetical protein